MSNIPTLKKGSYYRLPTGKVVHVLSVSTAFASVKVHGTGDTLEISSQSEIPEIAEQEVEAVMAKHRAKKAEVRAAKETTVGKQTGRSNTMTKKVFDKYSGVAFCRYLGTIGATRDEALFVADQLGLEISQSSVTTGLSDGRSEKYSKLLVIPELTKAEQTKVRALMKKAPKPEPKAKPAKKAAKKAAPKKTTAKKTAARKPITKESQVGKRKRTRKSTAKAAS